MGASEQQFMEALARLSAARSTQERDSAAEPARGVAEDELDMGDIAPTEEVETTQEDDGAVPVVKEKAAASINLFQRPDAHPVVLDVALLQKYGPEWLVWEPEVLAALIPQDFRTTGVSDLAMDKIQAMKTLHLADDPWLKWETFVWCCMPLNGLFPDFEVMQVPTAAQTLIAISIFNRVREDTAWSDEVKDYLGVVWKNDGVLCTVPPADFVTIDTEDLPVDCAKVQEQWPEVRSSRIAPRGNTVEGEQLRRLLSVYEYLLEDMSRLEEQMALLRDA